jgi:hypothetical protein
MARSDGQGRRIRRRHVAYTIGTLLSNVKNDSPELIEPP